TFGIPVVLSHSSPAAVPGEPVLAGVVEILLCIDFDVTSRRIDVRKRLSRLDHLLEQENLVCLFKNACLSPWLSGKLFTAAVIVLPQPRGTCRREFCHADVLAVGFYRWNLPVNASYSSIAHRDFFRIVGGM